MSLSPLAPVTDYQSMLNRVFWFTSAAALGATALLRANIPALEAGLSHIDFKLEFGDDNILPVPGSYLLPAVAVGLAARVFRLHGRLAEWLGIRERFDIDIIIHELARRVGVDLQDMPDETLAEHRHTLMRHGFYAFVSGREPQVDEQLIQRALDSWSWFWSGIEATVVFVTTGFVLIATGVSQSGFTTIVATLGLAAVALPAIRTECRRYAMAQVREIVADPTRAAKVREAFSCLQSGYTVHRHAA